MTRILVVDDEPSILAAVAPLLRARDYEVFTATSGQTALDAVDRHSPQLVILDLGLPDMDGAEVCRRISEGRATPIIVLSARNAEADKVAALDAGADDYVTKPFGPEELLARLRATLRRADAGTMAAGRIDRGDIQIDLDQRRVTRRGDEVRLTPEGVRDAAVPGAAPRSRPDAPNAPARHLGPERRRPTRAPPRARRGATEEDRGRPLASAVHPDRAVGRVPVHGRVTSARHGPQGCLLTGAPARSLGAPARPGRGSA